MLVFKSLDFLGKSMKYDKQLVIETLRKNLGISLGIIIDDSKKLLDDNALEELEILRSIKLGDIFNCTSINSPEQCLDEMIKNKHLIKNKSISEIYDLLKCDMKIISKTLKGLKERGGVLGYEIKTSGVRRGMKYTIQEVENPSNIHGGRRINLVELSKHVSTQSTSGGLETSDFNDNPKNILISENDEDNEDFDEDDLFIFDDKERNTK